ncbi:alcohol oxidase [Mycena filopes]|nr:alcohol oxidase [Mycena filopes]
MGLFGSSKYPVFSVDQVGSPFEPSAKPSIEQKIYDYVIVGGLWNGGVLSRVARSADPMVSVLLLERGPLHDAWYSRIPLISSDVTSSATPIVRSPSLPIKAAQGQAIDIVHAEALGGGSSVNAMLVTHGAVGDFEHWAELGHPSWNYESLKPYFAKSEKSLSHPESDSRGHSGPLVNQTANLPYNIHHHVKKAATALGFADIDSANSPPIPVDVCVTMDQAVDENLRRVSSFHAFLPLKLAQQRLQRLKICPNAVATRVEFDGNVATGAIFESRGKLIPGTFLARARREVVVCCGAIGSPQLLLLSGIGPKAHLADHGIATIIDLPGVGAHLQDHIGLPLMYKVPLSDTLHHSENSIWKGVLELAKYMLGIEGIMSSTVSPVSLFAHSTHLDERTAAVVAPPPVSAGSNRPDIEIMAIAHWCSEPPLEKIRIGVFSFLLCVLQPKSVGSVRLASADPHARPAVDLGFLADADDYVPFRKGVKLARRLAEQVASDGYPMMEALQVPVSEDDKDLDEFIRTHLRTCYHYASTCRMAKREGEDGVVDDELRVYGVQGLRVCDASVFPWITSSHTMAPVIAVAERCADLIMKSQ